VAVEEMAPGKEMTPPVLFVAHPGHELRLHGWLELAHPEVAVLTDGSGSTGVSRVPSTLAVLESTGAHAASVMGEITDRDVYQAVMRCEVEEAAALTLRLASVFAAAEFVVVDSWEGYNPVHDLCRVIGGLAAERAGVPLYEYPVVGPFRVQGTKDEIVIRLDDAALRRKLAAAYRYEELRGDVDAMLKDGGEESLRVEVLRPAGPPVLMDKPFYEVHGEQQVAAGRYASVLRWREHLAPFIRALTAACRPLTRARS
jgi:hypothetical protein